MICLRLPECQGTLCLFARNRRNTWRSSDCNRTQIHGHLLRKKNTHQFSQTDQMLWLNTWVLMYRISGCRFEFRCSHNLFYLCLICDWLLCRLWNRSTTRPTLVHICYRSKPEIMYLVTLIYLELNAVGLISF